MNLNLPSNVTLEFLSGHTRCEAVFGYLAVLRDCGCEFQQFFLLEVLFSFQQRCPPIVPPLGGSLKLTCLTLSLSLWLRGAGLLTSCALLRDCRALCIITTWSLLQGTPICCPDFTADLRFRMGK